MELTYQEVCLTNPLQARERIVQNLPTHPKLLRSRAPMPHLAATRAQVGATLPTIRRTRTARPAKNPQTPTQKNRTRAS